MIMCRVDIRVETTRRERGKKTPIFPFRINIVDIFTLVTNNRNFILDCVCAFLGGKLKFRSDLKLFIASKSKVCKAHWVFAIF